MSDDNLNERFPGNSYSKIPPRPKNETKGDTDDKIEKVTKDRVTLTPRKRGLGDKFKEAFLAVDMTGIVDHVIFDVLVPTLKYALRDMIEGATNMTLFGNRNGDRRTDSAGRSRYVYTSYDRFYDERNSRSDGGAREQPRSRARDLVEDVVFTSRGDAEEVLSCLVDRVREFGLVSVKAFYVLADVKSDFTKENYGWFNLEDARVIRVSEGYLIKLPKPVVLN